MLLHVRKINIYSERRLRRDDERHVEKYVSKDITQ